MISQPIPAASATRHPFRGSLPPSKPIKLKRHHDDQDLKLFVLSFTTFFICIYTFIF